MEKELFLVCSCGSLEHQMYLWYDETREWPEFYTEVHLNKKSFLNRLKYLFGHKSRFGAFDEFIFSKEEEQKLYNFLKERNNG